MGLAFTSLSWIDSPLLWTITDSLSLTTQCTPETRDWHGKREKCNYCLTHNKDCGPSIKHTDDPLVQSRKSSAIPTASLDGAIRHGIVQQRASTALEAYAAPARPLALCDSVAALEHGTEQLEEIHHVASLSNEQLKAKAYAKYDSVASNICILYTSED